MIALLLVVCYIYAWVYFDPVLHVENFRYLPFLLKDLNQGLQFNFVKIFDVCNLDDCFNRFRPVANAFHFLDALMIGYLNPSIAYHFKSISHLIFGLATALTFALTFKRLVPAKDYGFALALGAFITLPRICTTCTACFYA